MDLIARVRSYVLQVNILGLKVDRTRKCPQVMETNSSSLCDSHILRLRVFFQPLYRHLVFQFFSSLHHPS